MYKIQIVNRETLEILECYNMSLEEACRIANIAYFAAGYDDGKMEISVIDNTTGEKFLDW